MGLVEAEQESEDTADPSHLGGAHQDNRVVPYEGLPISLMTPAQREQVYAIIQAFNIYLPAGPLDAKMRRVRAFENQTYFAWIGKYGLGDPYYFRIHSPVVFVEFDFHCGSECKRSEQSHPPSR
jgi:hypothetical protein